MAKGSSGPIGLIQKFNFLFFDCFQKILMIQFFYKKLQIVTLLLKIFFTYFGQIGLIQFFFEIHKKFGTIPGPPFA